MGRKQAGEVVGLLGVGESQEKVYGELEMGVPGSIAEW